MDKQEIFDKIITHLRTQKVKSGNESFCMYKDANGNKCAVGCLIPDDLYDPLIDDDVSNNHGTGLKVNVYAKEALLKAGINTNDESIIDFLAELQFIHDSMADVWSDFQEERIRDVARMCGLAYTPN